MDASPGNGRMALKGKHALVIVCWSLTDLLIVISQVSRDRRLVSSVSHRPVCDDYLTSSR